MFQAVRQINPVPHTPFSPEIGIQKIIEEIVLYANIYLFI
jgi:hypothetical protein